jgi:hypothetical protein
MSRIGILKHAKGGNLDVLVNKPGSCNFSYPMDAEYAESIDKYRTGILAERYNWRSTFTLNAAGTYGEVWDPIWSGYILPITEDWASNSMTIGAVGWLSRLGKRLFREQINWNDIDDGLILRDALQSLNGNPAASAYEFTAATTSYVAADGYTVRWPAGSTPNTSTWMKWGGTLPNEGPGGATAYVPVVRDMKVDRYQQAGPFFDQVVGIENGCDIKVDPLTRQLFVYRRYRRVRDAAVIGFNILPRNAANFSRQIDGDQEVNYFLAQGDAGTTPGFADDVARIQQIGLIEEVQQLSGVVSNDVLLAYAGAEIIVRSNGVVTYGVTPFRYTPDGSVPEPFVDYREGDQVRISADSEKRGTISKQAVRVFGIKVSLDDNGNESIGQLQVAP